MMIAKSQLFKVVRKGNEMNDNVFLVFIKHLLAWQT